MTDLPEPERTVDTALADAGEPTEQGTGNTDSAWRLLLRNKASVVGIVVILVMVVLAVFGSFIAPYGANDIDVPNALQAPNLSHLFGTDDLGRDVFSRVVLAAAVSMRVAVIAVAISLVVGVIIGMVSGFAGGVTDTVLMRVIDVVFSFPVMLLALAIVAILGPGVNSATLAIGAPTELAADLGTRHMAAALRAGGVPFTYDRYSSGAHTFGLFSRELRDSWRVVGPALGA